MLLLAWLARTARFSRAPDRALAAALLVLVAPAVARAGGGPSADPYEDISTTRAVDLHALLDVYDLHNFNDPTSGTNQLREFDVAAARPSLNFLRVTLAHHPNPIGVRFDVGVGDTPDTFFRQDPAATQYPQVSRAFSLVEQGFVTVTARVAHGLEIDLGKFGTPAGWEDNETVGNWNYSRGLLYAWAEPTVHMGLRATLRATETLTLAAFWVNGWNVNVLDGNDLRTFAGALAWKPRRDLEAVVVYMAGPERAPTDLSNPLLSFRNAVNLWLTYSPSERLGLTAAADFGNDRGGSVLWYGVAGWARVQPTDWFAAALRGEVLLDPQGYLTGTRQALAEITTTLEIQRRIDPMRLIARLEYRHDQSDALVFEAVLPATRSYQDTLTLALLATF